ncbi:uncharacterized protein H6S33_004328 [Morchella sextelata]|uniref:uncharacterized protein n=1 Tax=Morchella sextelata TaxID=1174677 RepID=UPI001D044D7A|nr:uncharacterized protein H6S33_004328 [Morchella sextelata]KAH0605871.1 hypothetical protein H6S33_004328 [Morchella sextelata]
MNRPQFPPPRPYISPFDRIPMCVIVELMVSMTFADIVSFIQTSRTHYHIFLLFHTQIITRRVRRLFGRCGPEILTILHFQRPTTLHAPFTTLPKDFFLVPDDIPNLRKSYRVFRSVEKKFYEQQRAIRLGYMAMGRPFDGEWTISLGRFFAAWLHAIQFQYDDMNPFLLRRRLSPRILNSLFDLSTAVLASDGYELMKQLTAKRVVPGGLYVPNLFASCVEWMPSCLTKPEHFRGHNEVVRMKLVHHFNIRVLSDYPAERWAEVIKVRILGGMVESLMDDFGDGRVGTIGRIIQFYGLEKSAWPEGSRG